MRRSNTKRVVEDYITNSLRLDNLNVKDESFNDQIIDLYTKNLPAIRENIRKLLNNKMKKSSLRTRTMSGLLFADKKLACNNNYTELHPVFYIFGLILPHLTNIFQSDLCNAFMMINDNKQMDEDSTLLLKTILLSEVKMLDADMLPLTYDNQINVLTYLNILMHVIVNALFKIGPDDLPKLIDSTIIDKFNLIMDMKLKIPALFDKLNNNDDYITKVFRKVSLLFGKRTVAMKLTGMPVGSMFCENNNLSITNDAEIPTIEEFTDSFIIKYEHLNNSLYHKKDDSGVVNDEPKLSIKLALEKMQKLITVDNKIYSSKFKYAYSYLPVFIQRKDSTVKKDYVKVLMSRVDRCCNDSFVNNIPICEEEIFLDTDDPSKSVNINNKDYYPLLVGGCFQNDNQMDDVDFIYINPIIEDSPLSNILKDNDERFFCDKSTFKNDLKCGDTEASSFTDFVSQLNTDDKTPNKGCCDYKGYSTFEDKIKGQFLLYVSNKNCNTPMILEPDRHENIKCLISKSTSFVLYLTKSECQE